MEDKDFLIESKEPELLEKILQLAIDGGGIDGAHHKNEYLEDIVRQLTGKKFDKFKNHYCYGLVNPDNDDELIYGWFNDD